MALTTAPASFSTDPDRLSLIDLPAEVRNMIYKLLFPDGQSAVQLLGRHRGGYIYTGSRLELLRTCRQVFVDVSSLLRCQSRVVRVQPKTLDTLIQSDHWQVGKELMDHILPEREFGWSYDLDHRTVETNVPPVSRTCKAFRRLCGYECSFDYSSTLIVKLSILDELQALQVWLQTGRLYYMRLGRSLPPRVHVLLRFPSLAASNNPASNHVQSNHLLRIDQYLSNRTIFGSVTTGEDESTLDYSVDLKLIKTRLLVFTYALCTNHAVDITQPVPRFWINKEFEVSFAEIECEDGSVQRISNKYARCSDDNISSLMYPGIKDWFKQQRREVVLGGRDVNLKDRYDQGFPKENLFEFTRGLINTSASHFW